VQHVLAVGAAGDDVRELAVDGVDDRGAQQEALRRGRQRAEDLVGEVVGDRTLVAREVVDELVGRAAGADRDANEPESGGPALRPLDDEVDPVLVEDDPDRVEELARLVLREGEVGGAHLCEVAAQPEQVQRQQRVAARREDEPQLRHPAPEHVPERRRHDVGRRLVQVVDHDHERLVEAGERVQERVQERLGRLALGRGEEPERLGAAGASRRLEQPGPELGLGVIGTERQPGDVLRRLGAPLREPGAEEDGLARAGVRREQGQRPLDSLVEQPVEAGALDERLRRRRRGEIGADHGRLGRCRSEPFEDCRVHPVPPRRACHRRLSHGAPAGASPRPGETARGHSAAGRRRCGAGARLWRGVT
jgi:hypothetical protein